MKQHTTLSTTLLAVLLTLLLALFPLSGCMPSDSDDDSSNGSDSSDTTDDDDSLPVDVDYFILALNGDDAVTYEEVEADNAVGADPAVFAWYATDNDQVHVALAYGVGESVTEKIYALSWEPGDVEGEVTEYEEMRHETDFDFEVNDDLYYLSTTGDITVTETAALGERYEGTFSFTSFDPDDGEVTSAEGRFSVTREEDDAY